jgi:HAD superfamily hydrolase (TIGR01509 family)
MEKAKQLLHNAKAVIFDVDGLLIDSEPIWGQVKQEIIRLYGDGKEHGPSGTMGMGMKEAVTIQKEKFGLSGTVDMLIGEYRRILYDILFRPGGLRLMQGVEQVIKTILSPKPLGIATGGHTQETMHTMLTTLGLRKYFSAITSCDDVAHGKPAPDVYMYTGKLLGVDPSAIVVLEDADNGVLAGKNAGMTVIGVNTSPLWQDKLHKAGADVVIGSFEEIL